MTNEITLSNNESELISQRMAERAGENTKTFTLLPTLTVYNPSKNNSDNQFKIGDIVKTIKTEQGYSTEKYDRPFVGVILKVRMFLKLKYKYAEGKPNIITNEFDSYSSEEQIIVKQQNEDGKYEPVFTGNYSEINDKYSLKGEDEYEKKLELHHAIYVIRDLSSKEVVRIDSKGLSRSNFFDYMNIFSRRGGDFMSSTWTTFDSEISDTDYRGKKRQAPVAGLKFTKGEKLSIEELKKAEQIQIEFETQLAEKDKLFGNNKKDNDLKKIESTEDIPVIQIEEESKLPLKEDDEIKIEDVPF